MPQKLDPSAFSLEGGSTGILLIHGFTGSPPAMRLVGEYLQDRDVTVSAPLLPGHGTTPEDLNRQTWQDWFSHVEKVLAELERKREAVFVAGQSLGALLALCLAADHSALSGAVVYSPAIMVADWRVYLLPLVKHIVSLMPKPEDKFDDPRAEERLWNYDVYPTRAAHETVKLIGHAKARLPDVTCPLLIVYSRADETIHLRSSQI